MEFSLKVGNATNFDLGGEVMRWNRNLWLEVFVVSKKYFCSSSSFRNKMILNRITKTRDGLCLRGELGDPSTCALLVTFPSPVPSAGRQELLQKLNRTLTFPAPAFFFFIAQPIWKICPLSKLYFQYGLRWKLCIYLNKTATAFQILPCAEALSIHL